ncbi:MAG TPA: alpha/beta hydrolase [Gemmatimonadaceae bacterium]|nr:alpha/beta hydrolase [Gemmatimonadaceae bacterium]
MILLALGAVYVGLLLLLWAFQEQVVFQPPRVPPASLMSARKVHYRAADGVELFAYVVGDCRASRTLMIAFHGNADVARWLVPWAANAAHVADACVMLPEYRGYDGLAGSPSYAASGLDAHAALDYAREILHVKSDGLVLFGFSLGTAIATELAQSSSPRALVLEAPFTSARAMAGRMFVPGLTAFWSLIARVQFNTLARVRALRTRVWVAHGDRDRVIPVDMGREVFAACANRGELLVVRGAGHTDLPEVAGSAYWSWLARAIHADSPVPGRVTAANPTH